MGTFSGDLHKTPIYNFSMALFTSAVIAIIFISNGEFLTNLFLEKESNNYKEVYQLAISFINISAFFLCFDALQSVANGALRGLKDTFVPMLLSIGCYWVLGVAGAYYLSMHTYLGANGIWYGLTLGLSSTAIILVLRFFNKIKIENNKKIS